MKSILTLIMVCLFFTGTMAQITINFDDIIDVGDSVELAAMDNVPAGFSPGPAGPNQVWDFSNLVADTVYTMTFIDPDSTPYAGSFPLSNIAAEGLIEGFGAEGFAYATKNSSVLKIDGFAGSYDVFVDVVIPFDPPEVMFDFPINFGDSMSQAIVLQARVESPDPLADSLWLKRVMTVNSKVDGWGQVVTPEWTGEVLRIRDERISVDTVWAKVIGFWLYLESETSVMHTYKYMANDAGYPVVQFNTDETGTEYSMVNYLTGIDVGMQEPNDLAYMGFTIYPNPASQKITCIIHGDGIAGEIAIYDMIGRTMERVDVGIGEKDWTFDVSDYPTGVYNVVLRGDNGKNNTKKILVQ